MPGRRVRARRPSRFIGAAVTAIGLTIFLVLHPSLARVLDTTQGTTNPPADPQSGPGVAGMSLVLNEEFDGTSLNTDRWYRYTNSYGDGNNELQHYRAENIRVANSTMSITAKREQHGGRDFTSAFVSTNSRGSAASPAPSTATFYPRFGRYEMRARLPHAQGLWPAFWLRHRDGASVAEIDIMEYFHSQIPGKTKATLHLNNSSGSLRTNLWGTNAYFENPATTSQFHTFAMDILPEGNNVRFTAYLDGNPIGTYLDTDAGNWSTRHHGQPLFDVSVNMAIGGNWTGHPDDTQLGRLDLIKRCAIGGTSTGYPNNCRTTSPQGHSIQRWNTNDTDPTFDIDYIRIYQLDQ